MKILDIMDNKPIYFDLKDELNKIIEYFHRNKRQAVVITDREKVVGIISYVKLLEKLDEKHNNKILDIVDRNIDIFKTNDNVCRIIQTNQILIPIIDENGKIAGELTKNKIIGHLFSELEKLQEYCSIQDAIFDNSYDGLYITDGEGYTTDVNKAYTKITGLKKEDLVGFHMKDLIKKGYFLESVSLKIMERKKSLSIIDSFENGKRCLITGKPVFNDNNQIIRIVTNVRDMTELTELQNKLEESEMLNKKYEKEVEYLRKRNLDKVCIKGKSKEILEVLERIYRVAQVDATVLITGETGVGKELVAKEIHRNSNRKDGPFIKINCAAIPDNLLESELFGYEKGAFTGANIKGKMGLFELAQNGCILLDEIGELSLHLQAKLLRVLQEKEIARIGSTEKIKVNVRIIAATNKNLLDLARENKFREDLFYRLNVLPINVVPLRQRKGDISLLANYFLHKYNIKYEKNKKIHESTYELLNYYKWPGNVREIKNLIEQLVIFVDEDLIMKEHIKIFLEFNHDTDDSIYNIEKYKLNEALEILEKYYIVESLKKYSNTRTAAKNLGISQPSVVRKSKKYKVMKL